MCEYIRLPIHLSLSNYDFWANFRGRKGTLQFGKRCGTPIQEEMDEMNMIFCQVRFLPATRTANISRLGMISVHQLSTTLSGYVCSAQA